jgi:hypothetical protein
MNENSNWNRIPERIMNDISESLAWVAPQPSGGMIRFKTGSTRMSLKVRLLREENSALCTPTLLSGFCAYLGTGREKKFLGGQIAPMKPELEYRIDRVLPEGENEVTLYTPLQNLIDAIEIGLDEGTSLSGPSSFTIEKPILFYGSSITCGFSASRPGLTYPARVCRELDANLINYGFGGNAKGDPEIAEVIASLELSCFVMDYDHNTPSLEHLEKTHEPFFNLIRTARPDLPIVLVSSPVLHKNPSFFGKRRDAIRQTYENAVEAGDKRVRFVDGSEFFPADSWWDYTVDNLHPNDNGFKRMAEVILPVIEEVLEIQ